MSDPLQRLEILLCHAGTNIDSTQTKESSATTALCSVHFVHVFSASFASIFDGARTSGDGGGDDTDDEEDTHASEGTFECVMLL